MNTTSNGFKGSKWTGRSAGRGRREQRQRRYDSVRPYPEADATPQVIRIILADSEAIFRVGMSKIFAQQEDLTCRCADRDAGPDVECSREHAGRRDSLRSWAARPNPGRRHQRGGTTRHSRREAHHGYPARRRAGNRRLSSPRRARNSCARRVPGVAGALCSQSRRRRDLARQARRELGHRSLPHAGTARDRAATPAASQSRRR